MSAAEPWPSGARGALNLTFDNLGEAAELEMGALPADAPLGIHETALEVVPRLLEQLESRGIAATFFVEGLNAEIYPDLLREIDGRGHEVAFHAWRHEQWAELSAAEQTANLEQGLAAFRRLGLEIAGLRPPGGQLGAGGTSALREAGLRYYSPAGAGAGFEEGVALLPFEWRHVDASCVLPPLGSAREQIGGSPDPIEPTRFLAWLEAEIGKLAREGGYMAIVLHPFMLGWFGEERLAALLDRVAAAAAGEEVWVAPCAEVAERIAIHPDRFGNGAVLDTASWT
ncbi:MAG TPA: polysaccharide deacetylase family protein [Solirubrobacterales bacterium]|jgi:peptidoglycan/xylan/chitin deacetylase (PgdA/CDA1 family)|nr:polysaccharide deacetylase family protein [Solirubrobacterales bacterium]